MVKQDPEPFEIYDFTLQGGNIVIRWNSIRGVSYRIESSELGQTQSWQPASDPITAIDASTAWTNPIIAGPIHLYRVVQLPASPTSE